MAVERYIHGKHDEAHHDGRYSNVKRELQADVDESIGEQIAISLNVIRFLTPGTPVYEYHKNICDFWLERSDNEEKLSLDTLSDEG